MANPLRLTNVFLVPKLTANFISVAQLVDEGNKVTFLMKVMSFWTNTVGRRKQGAVRLNIYLQWIFEELDL